jgi:SET domain-containing protein
MEQTQDARPVRNAVAETEQVLFKESPIHGIGAFAKTSVPRGTRVIEYVGQRINKEESVRRCADTNEYIFALNDREDLDGDVEWNPARFINHSCSPNCNAELDNGRIWIVARRPINAGEEITFNYGYDLVDYKEYPCHCGSPDCVGYIVAEEFFKYFAKRKGG